MHSGQQSGAVVRAFVTKTNGGLYWVTAFAGGLRASLVFDEVSYRKYYFGIKIVEGGAADKIWGKRKILSYPIGVDMGR